jgi:hypothetical protein
MLEHLFHVHTLISTKYKFMNAFLMTRQNKLLYVVKLNKGKAIHVTGR